MLGPNPTYDYYLAPRLRQFPDLEIIFSNFAPNRAKLDPEIFKDALIFFCRYASTQWLNLVERHRRVIAGTALLLDDDLEALATDSTIPLPFRYWCYRLGIGLWPRLGPSLDLLFVSTPTLAARHREAAPRLLPPIADDYDLPDRTVPRSRAVVAYHATRTHAAEKRWLLPVARKVLRADPEIRFEIAAQGRIALRWGRLGRVDVVPPRPWPQYRLATRQQPSAIMLSPLLPSRTNASRSATRRIDAARGGAALLVSSAEIYQPSREEHALGMVVDLDPMRWANAITDLVREPERARQLADLNRGQVIAARDRQPPFLVPHVEAGRRLWRFVDP